MVGSLIKKYLDQNGIKYSFVASRMNISLSVFSALINDKRKITACEYFEICSILNVSENFFANQVKQVV